MFIQLDRRDRINRIRIERRQGRIALSRIDAVFADGRRQTLAYNTGVTGHDPTLIVDLPYGATGVIIDAAPTAQGRGAGWRNPWNNSMTARVDVIGVHVRRR